MADLTMSEGMLRVGCGVLAVLAIGWLVAALRAAHAKRFRRIHPRRIDRAYYTGEFYTPVTRDYKDRIHTEGL